VVLQRDGRIVVAGEAADRNTYLTALARFTPAGAPDPTFGKAGIATVKFGEASGAGALLQSPDGSFVTAGYVGGDLAILRFNADGTYDTKRSRTVDFGGNTGIGHAIGLQRDGKIVVAGETAGNVLLVRANPDGSLDPGFGNQGVVTTDLGGDENGSALAIQPDGRILVAGKAGGDILLLRYGR
jgi:uncharacterized delta-60 repeat protein